MMTDTTRTQALGEMMPAQFRKKPVVIEAWQWNADIWGMPNWIPAYRDANGRQCVIEAHNGHMMIPTLEGDHDASPGDWIIRGVKGELYPCKPDIFEATYEPVRPSPAPDEGGEDVSEAEVEELSKIFAEASGYYVPFHRGLSSPSADKLRAGIRAVLARRRSGFAAGREAVPAKFTIPGAAISGLVFQCGANEDNTEFSDAIAWVGELKDDAGESVHGLHAYSTEYPEDGSVTLAEFPQPAAAIRQIEEPAPPASQEAGK
jgi:hypothetical protein